MFSGSIGPFLLDVLDRRLIVEDRLHLRERRGVSVRVRGVVVVCVCVCGL